MRRSLPAAVLFDNDPRSADVANTVPAHAEVQRVGNCVLGYTKMPATIGGAQGARQRFTLLEMTGLGNRKALRAIVSYRREQGVVIEDDGSWAAVAADIAACIFGPGMTLRHVEGQALYIGLDHLDRAKLLPFFRRAAALRSLPDYQPLTGKEIGQMIKLDWRERDDLRVKKILAFNESTEDRRRRKDRDRKAAARAERAASKAVKPWEELGMAKSTYYYQRQTWTKNVGVSTVEGNADKNSPTPGNADASSPTFGPPARSAPVLMGNADRIGPTSTRSEGGSK
ncbi:hypothetical protein [Devosia naphthalenivorans]|uniref:hypothetical protein n=1 Tax=Devosia naphthalenivorans TaxID=2082392 RepID=UPI000D3B2438|nr:hypothetical protein [Devosia naphthalenivorans]